LTFGQGPALGSLLLLFLMAVLGILTVLFYFLPDKYTTPILTGLLYTFLVGMFSEILTERTRTFFGNSFSKLIFASKALRLLPALIIFISAAGLTFWQQGRRGERKSLFTFRENGKPKWTNIGVVSAFFLLLPLLLGTYLSEVINNVGIYILMGMGLNIVVGFAGLLDLGYVAFFAIGAYTMAVLTSTGDLGIAGWSFWAALPVCVAAAALAGVILGIPVLKMRGDYLAIVTLGFGEIIRILVLSDLLKPFIGGAQGVLKIPKPSIGSFVLLQPEQLYYVILGGVLLAIFVSTRLRDSRLGRQWMAMREDEDVAEAMGINLVNTKLMAFGTGAAFSGLAGAIFASKLTSIFPHSFNILISINVLSLIIVGGIGSLPGVAVGALILVGLPELLREFQEYRLLMYGMLLVTMMLARPEGFIPSEVHQREMHASEEEFAGAEGD
jgi:branched-chain amino acid transport system permease protein